MKIIKGTRLTENQIKLIEADARKLGVSFSEKLRSIIDKYYKLN